MVETPEGLRRRAYGGDVVDVQTVDPLPQHAWLEIRKLPFLVGAVTRMTERDTRLVVDDASTAIPALIEWLKQQNIPVERVEEYLPPYDDVFVELVKDQVKDEVAK
jgi:hypothetical protein